VELYRERDDWSKRNIKKETNTQREQRVLRKQNKQKDIIKDRN
jgi:hypothetical protein